MPNGLSNYITKEVFPYFRYKVPKGINTKTACQQMIQEGFKYSVYKKGIYVDSYKRIDVIKYYTNVYIPTLRSL